MSDNPSSPSLDILLSRTWEPDQELSNTARSVIGAAIRGVRQLGPGLQ